MSDYTNFEEYVEKVVQEMKQDADILGVLCVPFVMRIPVASIELKHVRDHRNDG